MGILATSKGRTSGQSSGMGFLLVFFPEEQQHQHRSTSDSSDIADKPKLLSSSPCPPVPSSFRRTHSGRLLSRAQSTISVCALLVCLTLLVFTLSTFDPPSPSPSASFSRRFLPERQPSQRRPQQSQPLLTPKPQNDRAPSPFWSFPTFSWRAKPKNSGSKRQFALQGMGTLYRRGTRAMSDLVVAHLVDNLSEEELRLFLRTLHRSGLTARADVVLIFPSRASASRFGSVIREEDESFSKLLYHYTQRFNATAAASRSPASFDSTHFAKSSKEASEPLWGKRARIGNSSSDAAAAESGGAARRDKSKRPTYGSVVGFEAGELDPENSLSGFLDHVPMSLRRWACYSMLLGRVRRNFKHAMLIDAKSWAVLGDPLGRVRSRSPETVHLLLTTVAASKAESNKHGRRNSARTQPPGSVSPEVVMGGTRGVRRLATAMLNEIVRASGQQHKRKGPVTESGVLSQLASNEFVLTNVNLVVSPEDSGSGGGDSGAALIKYGNNGNNSHNRDVKGMIMRQICSSEVDSSVYSDC
ncbi:uncharacterized protein LOC115732879 [Rhodamnia argentea]|uniref:Uncharacterized protein LOC115732879 n=1 Tax=Rhodamnia argentea TaxID=178133 RepID=A0A8B8NAG9_9MYRT|nr:uncharacterized protein LOC115732879 [Rhodamnia argentea]